MRTRDLLVFAISALWQHKVRTLLTLGGVVAGSFLLVVSISVGQGIEEATVREFRRHGQLRDISVFPGFKPIETIIPPADLVVEGPMSEAKRKRLRQSLIRHWPRKNFRQAPAATLTAARLKELEDADHVESVFPAIQERCRITHDDHFHDTIVSPPDPVDSHFNRRLIAGKPLPRSGRQCLVHEYLLYLWGITRDEDIKQVLGQTIRVEYRYRGPITAPMLGLLTGGGSSLSGMESEALETALAKLGMDVDKLDLNPAQKAVLKKVLGTMDMGGRRPAETLVFSEEFTIAGVVREWVESEDKSGSSVFDWMARETEVFLPLTTAQELFGRGPRHRQAGFTRATVTVDHEENVQAVTEHIKSLGYRCFSLGELLGKVRKNVLLLGIAAAFLAAMALLVAAIGITNMMLMSVLERTHEIGVMKAVGARNGHIQLIFLAEGVVLGAGGGFLGLLAGWLASFPGDHIARAIVEKQLGTVLEQSLFVFPVWLVLGVPAFALLVTTLAAVYPACRAARINPIQALRHE
jgi:putative ABC transport system permease protein